MKQTILHQKHLQTKAKMTDFQGWQVPLQFSEVLDEYYAVRTAAGLFDTGYLGRIEVSGTDAPALLQTVFTRNVAKMADGSAHYGLLCNPSGCILDDVLLFLLPAGSSGRRYLLTTNAMNAEKVLLWLKKNSSGDVQIADISGTIAQFALQGPQSPTVLENLAGQHLRKIKPGTMRELPVRNMNILVSRTGYTGEHGYELFVPADRASELWDAVMAAGSDRGILPCGLSSRDMLRLEMAYALYGNDIDETRTPLEAGMASFVDFNKEFIGKDALLSMKSSGVKEKLAGFFLLDKGIPKNGGSIFSENREIGIVTSGGHSPQLRKGIGLGYVISRYAQQGQEIEIEIREKEIAAKISELPFYKKK